MVGERFSILCLCWTGFLLLIHVTRLKREILASGKLLVMFRYELENWKAYEMSMKFAWNKIFVSILIQIPDG